MSHSLPLSLYINFWDKNMLFFWPLPIWFLYPSRSISHHLFVPISCSPSVFSFFYFDNFFSLSLLLYPANFLLLNQVLSLATSLSISLSSSPISMSLYLSDILYQCVSVSLITSNSLLVFRCVLLFFYYLSLHSISLCNSNSSLVSTIARLQSVRCPNAIHLRQYFSIFLILHHYLSLAPLLSLSLRYGLSLCLFFSTNLISHYPFIILNSGKKLCWISFFWWIWWW